MKLRRSEFLSLAVALALSAITRRATAAPPRESDGYYRTGEGVRVKKVAFVNVKVYAIWHFMKELPPSRDKATVIHMDTDKRFAWTMLRDVEVDRIRDTLRDAFKMNGYGDASKIERFVGAFAGDLKEKQFVNIRYSAANKTTTIAVQSQGTASIPGEEFMRAVWSIWFGNIDQPSLSDALLRYL